VWTAAIPRRLHIQESRGNEDLSSISSGRQSAANSRAEGNGAARNADNNQPWGFPADPMGLETFGWGWRGREGRVKRHTVRNPSNLIPIVIWSRPHVGCYGGGACFQARAAPDNHHPDELLLLGSQRASFTRANGGTAQNIQYRGRRSTAMQRWTPVTWHPGGLV
jgi:hypothetical protein